MVKKIRFPLEMENGVEVRSMEELRDNFSISRVLSYLKNGKLEVWLRDRFETDIADKVEHLDLQSEELVKRVCEIFNVPYDTEAKREDRIKLLKKYSDDEKFEAVIDCVVFTQDELYDFLDKDKDTIYLCGDIFSIPLTKEGVCYRGINQPTVIVDSEVVVDWMKKKICLENVKFDSKYQSIVENAIREKRELLKELSGEMLLENIRNIDQLKMVEFEKLIEDVGKIIGSKIFTNIWSSEKAYLLLDRIMLVSDSESIMVKGDEDLYVEGSLCRDSVVGFVYKNITANNENIVISNLYRSLKGREPIKALSIILKEYEKFSSSNDILCDTSGSDKNIALNLIFNYYSCNEFAKKIIDKTKLTIAYSNTSYSSEWRKRFPTISSLVDADDKEAATKLFIQYCRDENTIEESYKFIFWSLMILVVDKNSMDEYLARICDFVSILKITDEEFEDIICAVKCVYKQEDKDYVFKSKTVPQIFHKLFNMYGSCDISKHI